MGDLLVSEVQNTELKSPRISKAIPSVAEYIQGEVILFAADAIRIMSAQGVTILMEGREQTLDFVRTPLRFSLVLSDRSLIGKRRAAQRLMANGLSSISCLTSNAHSEDVSKVDIQRVLDDELTNLL